MESTTPSSSASQPLSFGALLRDYRSAAGLTQEALAERAGISVRTVSDLERGLYQVPHRDTVTRLVEALRLSEHEAALLEATVTRQRGPAGSSLDRLPDATPALPTGVLTLLLTDIEGSQRLWEQFPDQMRQAVERHDALVGACVEQQRGVFLRQPGAGDNRLAVFGGATEAVAAAVALQASLHAEPWQADVRLRVRVALHTGETDLLDGIYYGSAVNRAARLRALAFGGQSLLSESVWERTRSALPVGVRLRDLGEHQLRDHARPERIFELVLPGVGEDFPLLWPSSLNQHYETVVRAIYGGRLVLFAGDGINTYARRPGETWRGGDVMSLPSETELAAFLAESFDYRADKPAELPRVAQYISTMVGSGPLYEKLRSVFDADRNPSPFDDFAASLAADIGKTGTSPRYPLIISTSYDQGLERAFARAGVPFDLVTYVADGDRRGMFLHRPPNEGPRVIDIPNKYLDLSDQQTVILKVHGAIDRLNADQDSFVITEDHFLDYLTGGDISNLVPVTIAARMRRSHFLFLGYNLRDWNLRVILRRLWGEQRLSYRSWAIHSAAPDPLERGLWRERGVELLEVGLADYLAGLRERMKPVPPPGGVA